MDTETAQLVLAAIAVIGAVVWLIGLQFLTGSYRAVKMTQSEDTLATDLSSSAASKHWLAGSAEVDGQPEVLATKAASILAKTSPFGPIKIVEKAADRIVFELLGPANPEARGARRWLRQGELRFSREGQGRTRIEWTAQLPSMDWLLVVGGLFQVLGLIALVVGGWVIYTYVVSSPEPAVRWQTFQMLQVSHFLWPPFLFGALYRRGVRGVAVQFEALAHNLPFCGD